MLTSWYAGTRGDIAQGNDILVVVYEAHQYLNNTGYHLCDGQEKCVPLLFLDMLIVHQCKIGNLPQLAPGLQLLLLSLSSYLPCLSASFVVVVVVLNALAVVWPFPYHLHCQCPSLEYSGVVHSFSVVVSLDILYFESE